MKSVKILQTLKNNLFPKLFWVLLHDMHGCLGKDYFLQTALLTFTSSTDPSASPVGPPSSAAGFPLSSFLLPCLLGLRWPSFLTQAALLPHRLPRVLRKDFFIITNYLCGQLTCTYEYACPGAYGVSGALQQEVDGSVYIFVAVVEGDHALVLSLPSNLNQLGMDKTGTLSENWNFPDNYDKTK